MIVNTPPTGAQRSRAPTVLVVEDQPMIRFSMVECLRDLDIRVLEAETGDQAKDLFLSLTAIDVVFTDVQMPGVMDGLDLAQWLHDVHPKVALMITSGIAQKTELALRWCERASVFPKPYDEQAVSARIQALLKTIVRGASVAT